MEVAPRNSTLEEQLRMKLKLGRINIPKRYYFYVHVQEKWQKGSRYILQDDCKHATNTMYTTHDEMHLSLSIWEECKLWIYHFVASELKDPICHSDECQIGSFSSEATTCRLHKENMVTNYFFSLACVPHGSYIIVTCGMMYDYFFTERRCFRARSMHAA